LLPSQQPFAGAPGGAAVSVEHRDGRPALPALYQSLRKWEEARDIARDEIYIQQATLPGAPQVSLPILSFRSTVMGPALWILAGIHGEEPAGPVAIAQNVDLFAQLARSHVPFVLLPLCNPLGYLLDWRYPDARRPENGEGHSVGDCTHLLPNAEDPRQPRRPEGPACPEAAALSNHILALVGDYPPIASLDLHEDELADPAYGYVYSQGELGPGDPVALEVVAVLQRHGFAALETGVTRFGEPILKGVIAPTQDGSIDEMLSSRTLIRDGQAIRGPAARTVIVVETPTRLVPLVRRVAAHAELLRALPGWRSRVL